MAERFYKAVLYGGLRVSETLMWLPMPYLHPLRVEAVQMFITFDEVPWVNNEARARTKFVFYVSNPPFLT